MVHIDAGQLRRAATGALVVEHFDNVLRTLVVAACKSDVQVNVQAGGIDRARHGDAIDDLVRKS